MLIMSNFLTEKLKRDLKNTYRAYKMGVKKATAYKLIDIDAELPLQLLYTLSTYFFVILEFNYLDA